MTDPDKEGTMSADELRRQASECDAKASQLTREASMLRSAAFDYRRRAEAADLMLVPRRTEEE